MLVKGPLLYFRRKTITSNDDELSLSLIVCIWNEISETVTKPQTIFFYSSKCISVCKILFKHQYVHNVLSFTILSQFVLIKSSAHHHWQQQLILPPWYYDIHGPSNGPLYLSHNADKKGPIPRFILRISSCYGQGIFNIKNKSKFRPWFLNIDATFDKIITQYLPICIRHTEWGWFSLLRPFPWCMFSKWNMAQAPCLLNWHPSFFTNRISHQINIFCNIYNVIWNLFTFWNKLYYTHMYTRAHTYMYI